MRNKIERAFCGSGFDDRRVVVLDDEFVDQDYYDDDDYDEDLRELV